VPGVDVRQETTRYDSGARRKSYRMGREHGLRLFIPAAVLREAGIDPHGPEPEWSVWAPLRDGKPQRSLMLRFYATDLAEGTGGT